MLARRRGRTGWRRALVALAFLALALKAIVPSGFMPGTSLAAPIVLCPDQGPMPAMAMGGATGGAAGRAAHGGHGAPGAPHDAADHPCAFAGLGLASLAEPFAAPVVALAPAAPATAARPAAATVPGRGLAAPPPPSHAPPASRA